MVWQFIIITKVVSSAGSGVDLVNGEPGKSLWTGEASSRDHGRWVLLAMWWLFAPYVEDGKRGLQTASELVALHVVVAERDSQQWWQPALQRQWEG
eukprot:scaffold229468_cov36-Cyclotella_meneghiniana.AAC.1